MASSFSHSIRLLSLALFLLLLFTPSLGQVHGYDPFTSKAVMTHHGGPLLTGSLNVALIWYGNCGRVQKSTIRNFVKSLNNEGDRTNLQPQVSSWWQVVESYQSAVPGSPLAGRPSPKIIVKVVKQVTDLTYKYGKILTTLDYIPKLVQDATNGDPNLFPIIVTARDVTVQGLCTGKCADHGVVDSNKPYIVVGNPETECPGACGWPFHQADNGPKGMVLQPPNLNMAADSMVIALATALADTVTNPLSTGFYNGIQLNPIGPGLACRGIFGSGSFPGNPGKVHIDPTTGGAFNAHGNKGRKFLLPAIWNPKTSSCWTPM
ncbi:protein EXORDIUM-like 2 [Durio zibethinus]|uniref:Protein EXORDIUM-like 2 n=1 Tax=Durio zibethinus TaxID=66656 RepID=A0A6P5WUT9_DURZI|nr:protein EXORDIUM-like 2 [Durio zibethinus]